MDSGEWDPAWSLHRAELSGRSLLEWSEYNGVALWWFVHPDFLTMLARLGHTGEVAGRPGTRPSGPALSRQHGRLLRGGRLAYHLFALAAGRIITTEGLHGGGARDRILVISQNNQWKAVRDPRDGRERPGDAFFHTVIRELGQREEYDIVTCYPLTAPPDSWYCPLPSVRKVLRRRRESKVPHRVFDAYWSTQVWRMARRAQRHFQSIWATRLNLEELRDRVPGGANAYSEVAHRLHYYFHTVFGRTVGLLEMARRLMRAERPRLVLLINEYGRFERAVVFAARLEGVRVLALQHGVIHPGHPGYMLAQDEVSEAGSVRFPFCPLSDLTAVDGPYHRELLTAVSAYPPETVVVTGQPRYDLLASAKDWYEREAILKGLHADPTKRIVLWATQTHGLAAKENERNVRAVYGAMADLENAQLVIKLHPGEDQGAPLYRRERGQTPVIVDGRGDTIALLYAADVLITRHSTVATEATALDRPVVILNLSGESDPVDYVEDGVAVGVYRREDLSVALRRLLEDDSHLAQNRERFIARYLYRVDGKATERVVRVVDRMIEQAAEP